MLLGMAFIVLLFRNDKGIDAAGSKRLFFPWAMAFVVILAGSFLPELYTFLMMGELDFSIKQQISENAGFLLTGAVLFCIVFLSYKITGSKRFLRLLIADFSFAAHVRRFFLYRAQALQMRRGTLSYME